MVMQARKATCPECERPFVVRSDGKLRNHLIEDGYKWDRPKCPGGGQIAQGYEWMEKEEE
jgi:hypothetical protein